MSHIDPSIEVQRFEKPLNEKEQALRDVFVNEYLKDFNPIRACIRMGFLTSFATDQAKVFMEDGYVLRKIAFLESQSVKAGEEDRNAMLANLRWLAFNGTPASRATATQRYMEAQGYVKTDDGGEEAAQTIAQALRDFADSAPV